MRLSKSIAYLFFIVFFSFPNLLVAKDDFKPYHWDEDRSRIDLNDVEKDLPVIMLKYHLGYQYVYEGTDEEQIMYVTRHKITRVNNDQAIHENNKIYISTGDAGNIIHLKARAIQPDGQVVVMDQNNIREIKDDEGSGYRIFAIDGVEKGSEIEYYYTIKSRARFFIREFFQFNMPLKDASFNLTLPGNLKFAVKSYNGFIPVEITKENDTIRIYEAAMSDIPALHDEKFSQPSNRKMRIEFKLAYNSIKGDGRLFTWADVSKRIYHSMYNLNKESRKTTNKLIKKIQIDKNASDKDKIIQIEEHLKTGFYIQEGSPDVVENINEIINNKYGNERGLTKLYSALFDQLNIDHELVITIGRDKVLFDGSLDTWSYLDDYFFFFPKTGLYMAPYFMEYRLGIIPAKFTATQGLFIKSVQVRDFKTAIGEIRLIPALPYEQNISKLNLTIKIADDISNSDITMSNSYSGYEAAFFKGFYPLLEKDKKTELLENLVKVIGQDADISQLSVENTALYYENNHKPFTIHSTFKSASLIENAGHRYIIKIGDMIGPQTELYQKEERTCRVENDFNRGYIREITLFIPKGYIIKNPGDLDMDIYAKDEGDRVYNFTSTYHLEGNKLQIKIEEYYKKIFYPKEKFEDFRRVINAAADWNKIALVLIKN